MIKLLIVDDNQQNLYMLRVLLEGHNYQVVTAKDGAEALEAARRDPPDMIITDILMPVMDGFSLCREWKRDEKLKHIPLVFYTATYTDPEDEELALNLGAERFIIKPQKPKVLVEMLTEVIQEHQAGHLVAAREPIAEEQVYLKEYSEALVRKLEDKLANLERANRRLSSLHQASLMITSIIDLSELLSQILDVVVQAMGYGRASFFLFDAETETFCPVAAVGYPERTVKAFQQLQFRLGEERGLVGWVGKTREPLILDDTYQDRRWLQEYDTERSALFVPVVHKADMLGVMVFSSTDLNAFEEGDAQGAAVLASSVAIAIKNARLYEQAQREIAHRKRTEDERERLLAQIEEQARQLQQTVEAVPEGVLLLDADGRTIMANPAGRACLDELAGVRVGEVVSRLSDRSLAELLTSPPKGLWHEVRLDGSTPRIFEVITRPIEPGSKNEGWVMVVREVTQQREIEQRVQRQERLAAIGQLAAGIAHDFNNIIAVIMLYSQITLRAPDLPAEVGGRMDTIIEQSRRASDLINQVLDFSRSAVLERKELNLEPLLEGQIKLLDRTLPENINIELVSGPDEYSVDADLTRIQQVVMNLAVNARDAMPDGGTLRIALSRMVDGQSFRCVTCGQIDAGEWVRLQVSDTGTGIPAEVLPRIFEPFFTTKELGEGCGLGLAQVFGIVEQHDGHLDVATQEGVGTMLTVYLPALPVGVPSKFGTKRQGC